MAKNNSTGIQYIAKRLGISAATVSRALREETGHLVKPDRRRQIIELADSLRFRPNPGARFIRKGFNPTIGVIIPFHDDLFFSEFYGQFLTGILHAVDETDWEVKITMLSRKPGSSFLDKMRTVAMDCSGVIYCGKPLTEEEFIALADYKRPLVIMRSSLPVNAPVSNVNCHVIGLNNREAAATATRFLVQLGHQRIGLVLGPESSRDFHERSESYQQQLRELGINLPEELIYRGSYDHQSGRLAGEKFFSLAQPPTAILCASDPLAFGVLNYANEHNIKCPEKLSVIGLDDGPWAMCSSPKLTTMKQPFKEMAEKAVAFLQRDTNTPNPRNYQDSVELSASLVIRESTSPCPR